MARKNFEDEKISLLREERARAIASSTRLETDEKIQKYLKS
jgi:hypothetical protein